MHAYSTKRLQTCVTIIGTLCMFFFSLLSFAAPVFLPNFNVDIRQTSVSGLSSGAFMAVQFGVAYSSQVKGVGVIAGGPYYCAQGNLDIATSKCSCTGFFVFSSCEVAPGSTGLPHLFSTTDQNARDGTIDPTTNLAKQRVWMFSGVLDSVVPPPVMKDLLAYYQHYVADANVRFKNDVRAEHAFPTEAFGSKCDKLGSPYINDCNFDAAGDLLTWIYGPLQPRRTGALSGRIVEFDQSEFIDDRRPTEHGMAYSGFAYVPANCDKNVNQRCSLHVAFHGCKQDYASIGDEFIRHAGYNEWADANNIIVLYPQTVAKASTNPNSCWNWFDFDHDDPDYAKKNGRQMRAVKGMIDRIAGITKAPAPDPLPRCFTASNAEHVIAGRAHDWFFLARANGSNKYMGLDNAFSTTTLKQTGANYYEPGTCAAADLHS